jgi:hypothetical protein
MPARSSLTTAHILTVFTEEVAARGGRITDAFHDGQRLFTRSVLPNVDDVRPGDRVQGGVALKATAEGVWLYPYLFRLVCRNGAIIAETLASRSLGDLHQQEPDTAVQAIRECIEACRAQEIFPDTVRKMRTAGEVQVDVALTLLPLLSRLSTTEANGELLSQILERFFCEGDQSQFGLANAVTAVARDTQDPELRWNLEEFGGEVAIGTVPRHPANGGRAAMARLGRAVAVG